MKKILIKINNDKDFFCDVEGYIIGLEKFCILFEKTYNIKQIEKIRNKYINKKIFVSLNKPIFNDEVNEYKYLLKKLDDINIDGIIVSDQASLTYDLKAKIILDFMHLNNSYLTINHYQKNGAYGIMLTNDITKEEINEIRNNTNILLFKQVFGYTHLSTSKRKLLSNYFNYYKINNNKNNYYEITEDKEKCYKIIEEGNLTHILSNKILNLLNYLEDIDVDYYIIDGFMIKGNINDIVKAFLNYDVKLLDKITNNYKTDEGFINKKTVYKVIKNEK